MREQAAVVPFPSKAEATLLGCVLIYPDMLADAMAVVAPGDFENKAFRRIFTAMVDLEEEKRPIDGVTIMEEIGQNESGVDYALMGKLLDVDFVGLIDKESVREYARAVKRLSDLRALGSIAQTVGKRLAAPGPDPVDIARYLGRSAQTIIEREADASTWGVFLPAAECAEMLRGHIDRVTAGEDPGAICGIRSVDGLLGGFRKGNVYVVCGETSNGKTAFTLWLARELARLGRSTAWASLEMPTVEIVTRVIGAMTGLASIDVEWSGHKPHDLAGVLAAMDELSKLPIAFLQGYGMTVYDLETAFKIHRRKHDSEVLVVDYLQLLEGTSGRGGNRAQEVAGISTALKRIAMREWIPVVAISQFSRLKDRNAEDHRPSLDRLRDSGKIEEDASVVLGTYWHHRYSGEAADWPKLEVFILKNRHGAIGKLDFGADWKTGRFWEVGQNADPQGTFRL